MAYTNDSTETSLAAQVLPDMIVEHDRHDLQNWFATPLGQMVAEAEQAAVCELLARREGIHLLQVGAYGGGRELSVPCAVRQWVTDSVAAPGLAFRAWPDDLPLRSDSVNAVVLVHALEFAEAPHPILREAVRVLAPEGRLLIIGFNPISLWGLNRAVAGLWQSRAPWNGHYYGARRLRDWCSLLSMDPLPGRRLFYRPPLGRPGLQQRIKSLETFGSRCMPWFCGVNVLVSRKRVARIIPFSSRPAPARGLLQGRLANSNTQTRYGCDEKRRDIQ